MRLSGQMKAEYLWNDRCSVGAMAFIDVIKLQNNLQEEMYDTGWDSILNCVFWFFFRNSIIFEENFHQKNESLMKIAHLRSLSYNVDFN